METWYTDNQTYVGATPSALQAIEPALNNAKDLATVPSGTTGYSVTVTSRSNDLTKYTITNAAGTVTRSCDDVSTGGCSASSKW
jgi:hypothetical protein